MTNKFGEESIVQLLSCPLFWPPDKIISFLVKVHDYLQTLVASDPQKLDAINTEAQKFGVLEYQDDLGSWNWGKGFQSNQLAVLTYFYTSKKQRDKKRDLTLKFDCISELVKTFRHKYVHQKELPDEAKECLFGAIPHDKLELLLDVIYMSFWTSKFPRIVSFLWLTLRGLNTTWGQYYPVEWSIDLKSDYSNPDRFFNKLNEVMCEAKFHGYLKARYAVTGKTLEVYQLETTSVHKILNTGCTAGIMHIYRDHITFHWTEHGRRLTYSKTKSESNSKLEGCTLAVVDQVTVDHLCNAVLFCKNDRIICISSNTDKIEVTVRESFSVLDLNFREMPLSLYELDKNLIQDVYNGNIVIGKNRKIVPIRRLFGFKDIKIVKGNYLITLLRGEPLWLFPTFTLPKVDPFFMTRQLCNVQNCTHNEQCLKTQTELRKMVNQNNSPGQIVYIPNKCGMGKSEIIRKIANEIQIKYKTKFVLLFTMRKFIENLVNNFAFKILKICDVVSFINQQISQTDLERDVVKLWFGRESRQRIILDLFFDGLDEVSEEWQEMSLSVITLISENCPSVRLWITSRDHMKKDIEKRFQTLTYQLLPLNLYEFAMISSKYSIQFLKQNYSRREIAEKRGKAACYKIIDESVGKLKVTGSDLTSVPLHCEMFAEYTVSAILNGYMKYNYPTETLQLSYETRYLLNMYDFVIKRKCEFFLKKFNLEPVDTGTVGNHYRNLQMSDMCRSATLFSLEIVFGRKTREAMESLLIPDEIVKKVILDQGFVQNMDNLVFCHRSICKHIVTNFILNVITKDSYLNVDKNDVKFRKFVWEEMLSVRFEKVDNDAKILFKHPQICKGFDLFCKKYIDESSETKIRGKLKWFRKYYEWICGFSAIYMKCFHSLINQDTSSRWSTPNVPEFSYSHLNFWIVALTTMEKDCNQVLKSPSKVSRFKNWLIENVVRIEQNRDFGLHFFPICVLDNIYRSVYCPSHYYLSPVNIHMSTEDYVETIRHHLSEERVEHYLNQGRFETFEEIVFHGPCRIGCTCQDLVHSHENAQATVWEFVTTRKPETWEGHFCENLHNKKSRHDDKSSFHDTHYGSLFSKRKHFASLLA